MPQKFEQMQSAEQKHDEDETIAQAGTQIDDTVDALDAVLDDIESVLESNAEEYVGSFVQKGCACCRSCVTAATIPQRRLTPIPRTKSNPSPVFSASKPNTV